MALRLLDVEPAMENNLEPLRFLTLEETAQLLHLSRRTLQRMIHRKELPALKVGSRWRIPKLHVTAAEIRSRRLD